MKYAESSKSQRSMSDFTETPAHDPSDTSSRFLNYETQNILQKADPKKSFATDYMRNPNRDSSNETWNNSELDAVLVSRLLTKDAVDLIR